MTSKWIRSAPAASTASTSSPRRAKSADRIEGAIQAFAMGAKSNRSASAGRQTRERLAVLVAGARDHLRRQLRPGGALVPGERLEVVAHVLLVEARRARADTVGIGGPEARGVRGEHLVDEREGAGLVDAELELGVGDD